MSWPSAARNGHEPIADSAIVRHAGSAVELENRELQVEPPAEKEEPKEESAVEREQPAEEEEARDANEAAEEGERAFEDWIAAGDEEEQAGGQAEASTIPVDEKEVANLDLPQVTEESVSEEAQRAQDTEPEPEPEPEPEEPEEEEEGPHAPYSTPVDREAPETARESPARTATPPKAAEPGTGILEKGHIYFLYRPKVRVEEAESFDDVQRMFIILKPSDGGKCRLIIVGRKRLPDIGAKNRFWAFVDAVAGSVGEITRKFEAGEAGSSGNAKTSQPVRPAGMGAYVIVEHNKHSHLAYSLQLPQEPGEVQEAFNIGEQGSFVLSIKNPEKPAPPGVGLGGSQKAEFPQDFQERFGGRRFIDANPPTLLDFEGAELLLIGASAEVAAESQEAAEMLQGILEEDEQEIQQLEDEKVFREWVSDSRRTEISLLTLAIDSLEMDREQHPAEPLSGIWA